MVVSPAVVDTTLVVDVSGAVVPAVLVVSALVPVAVCVVLPPVVAGVEFADEEETPSVLVLVVLAPVLVPGSLPGGTGLHAISVNRTSEREETETTIDGRARSGNMQWSGVRAISAASLRPRATGRYGRRCTA